MSSIPISPCFPKFRAFRSSQNSCDQKTHQIGMMLASNSIPSLPRRHLLPPSIPNLRVSNFRPKFISLLPQRPRLCETHQRFSRKEWKVLCFRNDEYSSSDSHPDAMEKALLEERIEANNNNNLKVGKRDWISFLVKIPAAVRKVLGEPWNVPWKAETIFQVMLLWIVSFWFIGSWMIPFGAHLMGFNKESLTFRGQALFSLLTDITEGLAGILILRRCLSRFHPLPCDWFKFSMKGNWLLDLILGCLMFPLVNRLSQLNLNLLPILPSTPVTLSSVEQSILARDPVAMSLYALVLVVCAPMWEEIVFRGFLLPSLTKYMPVSSSILVSSVAFALAHFNVQRMLPLIFLGVVMGIIYARSRNLLPSILLHSLWNGFVFLDLMK
ncbi:unnamed protein product [Cuscuta campestris]|uniref:CAAX prenyl protease 2/Lysostaphin resistance protein A-like domain-containing protein n=1 Tax=Cuscuta campestris TaxID=132261 RepID=A0A484KUV1_9ASTE|nr:unnamed protein product [Cuscuta campestris]